MHIVGTRAAVYCLYFASLSPPPMAQPSCGLPTTPEQPPVLTFKNDTEKKTHVSPFCRLVLKVAALLCSNEKSNVLETRLLLPRKKAFTTLFRCPHRTAHWAFPDNLYTFAVYCFIRANFQLKVIFGLTNIGLIFKIVKCTGL